MLAPHHSSPSACRKVQSPLNLSGIYCAFNLFIFIYLSARVYYTTITVVVVAAAANTLTFNINVIPTIASGIDDDHNNSKINIACHCLRYTAVPCFNRILLLTHSCFFFFLLFILDLCCMIETRIKNSYLRYTSMIYYGVGVSCSIRFVKFTFKFKVSKSNTHTQTNCRQLTIIT